MYSFLLIAVRFRYFISLLLHDILHSIQLCQIFECSRFNMFHITLLEVSRKKFKRVLGIKKLQMSNSCIIQIAFRVLFVFVHVKIIILIVLNLQQTVQ